MASASVYQGHLTRNLPPLVAELLPGFASDAQRALQFVRSTPGIGTALVGMKSTTHVEENAAVARRPPTPWKEFQRLFSAAGEERLAKHAKARCGGEGGGGVHVGGRR